MNSINLPCEYIMQMYVDVLAKKGVDKVLLIETLEEINEMTIKFLTMAKNEIMNKGKNAKKIKTTKKTAKKNTEEKKEKPTIEDVEDEKPTVEDVEEKPKVEKPTVEDVEKLFGTPSPSPKPQETCPFEFKGGKKNGTTCGKPLAENSEFCAVHGKKKTSDKKTVKILSDSEEVDANQVVANKKLPCEFKLTAGKNKGKACGKIDCKAHVSKIVPKPTQEN